jgi:hypothetical protein
VRPLKRQVAVQIANQVEKSCRANARYIAMTLAAISSVYVPTDVLMASAVRR